MSDVVKKTPKPMNASKYKDLIDAAIAQPGEWFACPIDSTTVSNAHNEANRAVSSRFAEVSVRGGQVFLRIRT